MATKKELLELAEVIRTQTEENANTADLVGSLLKLIINYAADTANAVNQTVTEILADALSQLTPGEGGEYILDGVTSGTFNEENNTIELKNAAGEVISTIDLSSIGGVGKGIDKSDELFSEFGNPYIVRDLLTSKSGDYKGKKYFQIAKAGGDSSVTRPISVKPGDKIRYTGWVADGYPAVVGFKEIRYVEGNDHLYAYIYEPKVYLGRWKEDSINYGNANRFDNALVEISESDDVDYIVCCGWLEGRNGAPEMKVIINGDGGQANTDQMTNQSLESLSYPTQTFIPEGKKILLNGASFTEDYDWVQIVRNITGREIIDDARGGSKITGSLVARLMYRTLQGQGFATKTLPHGIVFSRVTVNGNSVSVSDEFTEFGVIVINHVYNNDVFNITKRGNSDPANWSADEYEAYFKVVDENKNDIVINSINEINTVVFNKAVASLWKVIPKNSGDTKEMTPAEAFDYAIKRIKSWNNEIVTLYDGVSKYPSNDCQIIITSHWCPGRPIYNETSRKLAVKHNICYCELDKALGFVKGDDVYIPAGTIDKGYTINVAGIYNKSVLYSKDIDSEGEQLDGHYYWGRHLKKYRGLGNDFNAGYFINGSGEKCNTTWPQQAWAHAIVRCLGLDVQGNAGSESGTEQEEVIKDFSDTLIEDRDLYINEKLAIATSSGHEGEGFMSITAAAGGSRVTIPIKVKPGDKIRYTGWVADGRPAVVGFKDIRYVEGHALYAYIYEPKVYLGGWKDENGDLHADGTKFDNALVEISESDDVDYIVCCGWLEGRNGQGGVAPKMLVTLETAESDTPQQADTLAVRQAGGMENFSVGKDGSIKVWYKGELVNLQSVLARMEESINASGNEPYEPVGTFSTEGFDGEGTDGEGTNGEGTGNE